MADTQFVKYLKSSPVPFRGQKRKWTGTVYNYLKLFCQHNKTVVDLFGGSGLLSRTAKDALPDSEVIFNDFDNVVERIENYEQTLNLIYDLKHRWVDEYPKDKRIPNPVRDEIRQYIFERWLQGDYIDWVTLSSRLFFSGNYASSLSSLMHPPSYYNRMSGVLKSSATSTKEYIDGLLIEHCDYKKLIEKYYGNDILFIADPPYPNTHVSGYKGETNKLSVSSMTNEECAEVVDAFGSSDFILFSNMKSRTYEEVVAPRLTEHDIVIYRNAGRVTYNVKLHEEEFMWCRNKNIKNSTDDKLLNDFINAFNNPLER